MRSRRSLVAPLVFLLIVGCATGRPTVRGFQPTDRVAVQAVLDAQVTAWNRGDLAAYMAGYARTDALVFTSGSKVRRGWQATFDAYQLRYARDLTRASGASFREPTAMGTLAFEVLSIDAVGSDGAVVLGTWVLTHSPSDGRGVFSVVLERRPEGWKVIHDHTSAAPPAEPDAPAPS
ncbi:MAG: nuclear transport factor 2 family protein [Myxococcota bacterium]|nr:nuclear transport factor 2 family protein [Myxococcota bacterium]